MISNVDVETIEPLSLSIAYEEHARIQLIDSLFINTIDPEPLPVESISKENIEIVSEISNTAIKEDTIKKDVEIPVESKESVQVTIDGKPINEWLFGNEKPAQQVSENAVQATITPDNRLQTPVRPVKNKPVDILDTIKRYQNVRLDDAKRTSR